MLFRLPATELGSSFEWCVWIGYAVYGLAFAPAGLLALVGQAVILASIWGITGIQLTHHRPVRRA